MLAPLLLLMPMLGALAAPLDDVADRVSAFEKAFRSSPKKARTVDERKAAIAGLAGLDAPAVAEALTDAYAAVEDEAVAAGERKREVDEQLASMLKGQEFDPSRTLDQKVKSTFESLKTESRQLDARIDGLRGVQDALLASIEKLESEASVGWLLPHVVGAKKLPFRLKLHAARTAGDHGAAMAAPLTKALAAAASPDELAAVLEGLGRCGAAAQGAAPAVPAMIAALAHDDPAVREQAALALARLAVPQAIAPLVARLEMEEGATQRRIGSALEILTRQKLGDSPRAWKEWFAKDGERYASGAAQLGGGTSTLAAALGGTDARKPASVYYYGIPQEGKSVVYVIDCSGSMVQSVKDPQNDSRGPVDAGPDSRMEATKDALIEVLGKLTKDSRFDIVCFNDLVHRYSDDMLAATPAEVRKAQDWVRALTAAQTTNIHDAMQEAFRLAGRGARDKYYKSAVDTIFLLTDGSPTKNDGTPDSTERVLTAVRAWNPTQHVVIHTIGIGKDLNLPFLQQLARENGGRYVQQ